MRRLSLVLLLIVAGCSTALPGSTSAGGDSTPDIGTPTDQSPTSSVLPSATATTPVDAIGVFLAVVDEAMAETEFAGYAIDEPEDVLIVGQVFCELRDAGYTDEESLTLHLEGLAELREVTDADALFAGTVMGAAFEALCPPTE